ncbi:MAG TPA: multicopper oxidase domain-containing protein [Thermoplasmata archaeon]|nr:multicopper oxidase domain-containing protein [Thermoplasmata archaeon]
MGTAAGPGAAPGAHEDPRRLIAVLFVVGTVMAILVGYLGETGRIGGPIPGTYPNAGGGAPACQGSNRTGSYHFVLIAGERGSYTFNGTSPGPCLVVGLNSQVQITFRVDPNAMMNHSFDIIPAAGLANATPVFSGAGFTGPARFSGLAPGSELNFTFTASTAGSYRYICEMSGHYALGMYGLFSVAAPSVTSTGTAGSIR